MREWAYVMAHAQRLSSFFLEYGTCKKGTPGYCPGNASLTVKSMEGPSKGRRSEERVYDG